MTATPLLPILYETKGAAQYLGISPETLERWRLTGTPFIPYIKYGDPKGKGPVRYRKSDLDQFIANSVTTSTSARR